MKKAIRILEHIFAIIGVLTILGIAAYCIFTGTPVFSKNETATKKDEKVVAKKEGLAKELPPLEIKKENTSSYEKITYENITDDPYRGQNGSILGIEKGKGYEITYRKFETERNNMYYYTHSSRSFHAEPNQDSEIVQCDWEKLQSISEEEDYKSKFFITSELAVKKNLKTGEIENWAKGSLVDFGVKDAWLYCWKDDLYRDNAGEISDEQTSNGISYYTENIYPESSFLVKNRNAKIYANPGLFDGNEVLFDSTTTDKKTYITVTKSASTKFPGINNRGEIDLQTWYYCELSGTPEIKGWVQDFQIDTDGFRGGGHYNSPEYKFWLSNFSEI